MHRTSVRGTYIVLKNQTSPCEPSANFLFFACCSSRLRVISSDSSAVGLFHLSTFIRGFSISNFCSIIWVASIAAHRPKYCNTILPATSTFNEAVFFVYCTNNSQKRATLLTTADSKYHLIKPLPGGCARSSRTLPSAARSCPRPRCRA